MTYRTNVEGKMRRFIERFCQGHELPILTPMPAHVRDLHIDFGLLSLQMATALKPNPAVESKQATSNKVRTGP